MFSSSQITFIILGAILAACGVAVYSFFLSPLARFPGPKLAALTGWYETYFDCFRKGRYWIEIEDMHKKYGK